MGTIWRDVKGYEGLYQVSNLGDVKSIDHITVQMNNGVKCGTKYKGKLLKPQVRNRGYLAVHLSKGNVSKWELVHRLVATAFCEKANDNYNVVNHLDNNPSNNNANNLEWTDYKGNMQYATKQGRMHYQPQNLKKAIESHKIPVIASNDKETIKFSCAMEAEKFGFNHRHISKCCRKQYGYKTHKGYTWRYDI